MELKGFKRLNESVSPELLNPEELVILENATLDEEMGRPLKRYGWSRFNTNQADTTGNISSLHEVITSNGDNYLLAGINGNLRKSLNGTSAFDTVTPKGTPPYRMQAYADTFIFTDGNVAPFVVSGAALATVNDLEIAKPDVVLGADGVNGVQTGLYGSASGTEHLYKYIIVYVTNDGNVSPPSYPISVLMTPAANRVGFTNLPISTDSRVTQRYIYRTKADEEVYYFHSQIDNTITELMDYTTDEDLGTETFSYLDMPETAKYITLHKERLVLGNLIKLDKNFITPTFSKGANFSTGGYPFTATEGFNDMTAVEDTVDVSVLTPGNYQYRVVFLDADGIMSDYIDSNIVSVPSPGAHPYYVPLFSSLPSFAYGYGAIKSASVYRSDNGGGFKFLYSYNPVRPSGVLTVGSGDYGLITPTTDFATNQENVSEKCAIAFSEIGTPSTFRIEDIRNIFPDDGDEITGIYDDQDGILIFKQRSICKIYTNGSPDNWRLVKLYTNLGCDEPNSLYKYGNDYVFSSQKSIYLWNSGSGLKEIGVEIWDTLNNVTTFYCASGDAWWFLFGVASSGITGGYGFLVYDRTMGSWYKFTTTTIPYVVSIKEHGTNAGVIITSNATYLLYYNESATVDSDTGSNVQITPIVRTKTFGEGISLQRLRRVKFNYKKLDGQNAVITVTNPDSAVTNTYTDSTDATDASDWKLYESPVKETDSLHTTPKFYINLTGAGLLEWGDFRLETRPRKRGKREH